MTSRVGAVIDALVTQLGAAVSPVQVFDGPIVTEDPLAKIVGVGWDGDADGDMAATGEWTQEVASFDDQVTEQVDVLGYVSCWTGDDEAIKPRRDEALLLLGQVEAEILSDPTLGMADVDAVFTSGGLFQESGQYGKQARITFTITVRIL